MLGGMSGLALIWVAFIALAFWAFHRFKWDDIMVWVFGAWVFIVVASVLLAISNRIWPGWLPT